MLCYEQCVIAIISVLSGSLRRPVAVSSVVVALAPAAQIQIKFVPCESLSLVKGIRADCVASRYSMLFYDMCYLPADSVVFNTSLLPGSVALNKLKEGNVT
jgi:hypothetical protein